MRVLIIFNHPAPYKVKSFNELSSYVDLTVLFERHKAKDRPDSFYDANDYKFKTIFLEDGYIGREGSVSNGVKNYIGKNYSNFDLIIMNGYSHLAEIKAIRYMSRKNIRFGLLINGGLIKKETFLKKMYKTSLVSKADYYISPSKVADNYLVYYGAKKERIHRYVYSNYYERDVINSPVTNKKETREKYGLPTDKKIFVNASQFIARKNNIQLISYFKNRNDILLLIGQGKELNHYKEYIKENNINNVKIFDFKKRNELFEILKVCDVYITLSKQDIFGHTTLEAFSCGLPVISSDKVVSSLEYIKDGFNGKIVKLNDDKSIVEAMDQIDYSLSKNAIESAKNNTFENTAKTLYKALGEVYEK